MPPKALRKLAESFAENLATEFASFKLNHQGVNWYASPRRLGLRVTALEAKQSDKGVEKRGPAVAAAFDADGNPTKAAMGWARGCGIDVSDAQTLETDKGAWLLHKAQVEGQATTSLMSDAVNKALAKLPIPKQCAGVNKHNLFALCTQRLSYLQHVDRRRNPCALATTGHCFYHPEK